MGTLGTQPGQHMAVQLVGRMVLLPLVLVASTPASQPAVEQRMLGVEEGRRMWCCRQRRVEQVGMLGSRVGSSSAHLAAGGPLRDEERVLLCEDLE
jgi:hypothetical protein